jgi:hypothetical protein
MQGRDRVNPQSFRRSLVQRATERVEWKKSVQIRSFHLQLDKIKRRAGEEPADVEPMPADCPNGRQRLQRNRTHFSTQNASNGVSTGFSLNEQKRVRVLVVMLRVERAAVPCTSCPLRLVPLLGATAVGRGKEFRRTAATDVKQAAGVERKAEC